MLVRAYLIVTPTQLKEIDKYIENYTIVEKRKRKNKRCDWCGAYCPCTKYEGYCSEGEGIVSCSSTCEEWHEY